MEEATDAVADATALRDSAMLRLSLSRASESDARSALAEARAALILAQLDFDAARARTTVPAPNGRVEAASSRPANATGKEPGAAAPIAAPSDMAYATRALGESATGTSAGNGGISKSAEPTGLLGGGRESLKAETVNADDSALAAPIKEEPRDTLPFAAGGAALLAIAGAGAAVAFRRTRATAKQ